MIGFLYILINRVFLLSDHSFYTIDSAFHNSDGIGDFIVVLEAGVEGLVGFDIEIWSESRVILVAI